MENPFVFLPGYTILTVTFYKILVSKSTSHEYVTYKNYYYFSFIGKYDMRQPKLSFITQNHTFG